MSETNGGMGTVWKVVQVAIMGLLGWIGVQVQDVPTQRYVNQRQDEDIREFKRVVQRMEALLDRAEARERAERRARER